jgi:hypothetical protein
MFGFSRCFAYHFQVAATSVYVAEDILIYSHEDILVGMRILHVSSITVHARYQSRWNEEEFFYALWTNWFV